MDARVLSAELKDLEGEQAKITKRLENLRSQADLLAAQQPTGQDMKRYTVFLAVPAYKWPTDPRHQESVRRCGDHPGLDLTYRCVIGDAHIERARATLLMHYLKYEKPYDVFLNVDWDIEFEPDDIYRMCQRMEQHDVGVLGGPYAFKTESSDKAGKIVCRPKDSEKPTEDKVVDVWYCGTGFMMVRDSTMKALQKRYRTLKFNMNPDLDPEMSPTWSLWNPILITRPDWGKGCKELLSEDYSFCHRVWQMGERVALDLTVKLTHWNGQDKYELPMQPLEEGGTDDAGRTANVEGTPDDEGSDALATEAA